MKKSLLFVLGLFFWVSASAEVFDPTRKDLSVPEPCRAVKLEHFKSNARYFVVGIRGAKASGFHYEVDLARDEASRLWDLMKLGVPAPQGPGRLNEAHRWLVHARSEFDIDFKKEGDILEALSIQHLRAEYPENEYFITGGIEYRDSPSDRILGELDLVVERKSDCAVVALGEAKLGKGQLGHAKDQLRRIHSFLQGAICKSGSQSASICQINVR